MGLFNDNSNDAAEDKAVGILGGNPAEEPMHYGEIYGVWQYSLKSKGCLSGYQAFLYHAGDQDLKQLLDEAIKQTRQEMEECDSVLLENGIAPAPALPERPPVELVDIPVGARFTDPEIAAALGSDVAVGLVTCSQIMGMSIREDIGMKFAEFQATKATFGLKVLRMSKSKGWLIPPPLQIKRPTTVVE